MIEFENYFEVSFDEEISVATLAIKRRDNKYNSFNSELMIALKGLLESYDENERVKGVILTSAEKVFSTGADIEGQFDKLDTFGAQRFSHLGQRIFQLLERSQFITMAAVNGFALGGGLEIALACDFRIASTNARFGLPEINLGIMPGWGGTQRLPKLIGTMKALEIILTGEPIGAQEAKVLGLVLDVVEPDKLMPRAKEYMAKVTKKSRLALAAVKRAVHGGLSLDMDRGLDLESETFGLLWGSEDRKEGVEAFLKKRKPNFKR
jgi:enoyl-CoA hydratase